MSVTTGTVGTALTSNGTLTLTPSNATGVTKTFALSGTGAAGLSVDSTGKVTGNPTTAGTCTVTATVKDDSGNTESPTATITIGAVSVQSVQQKPAINAAAK